ncbi:hypothetical protein HFX_6390 (plasmid) [Haloferax mediterranei ATCC 33500]|uniref:Uncharacterized protein n=2 Tax=Haloferax mediterranei (strain ATCC 33500 / DSM 1411 / JCM 8866 / NBRC 14739 / NCIMB 2177 / R-4) TaxID=523841 RepID=I3RBA0_HALMT|nr:hypothetical protein HFX_6390 [Haloferax mediterranei ATCC 33500]
MSVTLFAWVNGVFLPFVVFKWFLFATSCNSISMVGCSVKAQDVVTNTPVLASMLDSTSFSEPDESRADRPGFDGRPFDDLALCERLVSILL